MPKLVDIIAFDNISILEQEVLPLSFLKVSLKQLALIIFALLIGFALKGNIAIAIIISSIILAIAFYKPYSLSFDTLLLYLINYSIKREIDVDYTIKRKIPKNSKDKRMKMIREINAKPTIRLEEVKNDTLYNEMFKRHKEINANEQILTTQFIDTVDIANTVLYYNTPNYKNLNIILIEESKIEADNNAKIILPNKSKMRIIIDIEEQAVKKVIVH